MIKKYILLKEFVFYLTGLYGERANTEDQQGKNSIQALWTLFDQEAES